MKKINHLIIKDQERHMKAELSVFKITAQDRKYRDKLIKGINPPRSMELYFKAYTEDEGVDLGNYRIPDSYFKSNKEKDLAYDNQFMKNKVVEILNDIYEKWDAWQPVDPIQILIKKSIDNVAINN